MLRTAMGPLIAAALEDPTWWKSCSTRIAPLWIDRLSSGRAPMGVELSEADGERSSALSPPTSAREVHRGQPLLSAELPETGRTLRGHLAARRAGAGLRLAQARHRGSRCRAIEDGMMTAAQADFWCGPCASARTS